MPDLTMDNFSQALDLHRNGRLNAAKSHYRLAIEKNPGHADAMHLLGLVEFQDGNLAEAERWIRDAIRVNGDVSDYHLNHALILSDLGRSLEAEHAFRRVLGQRPEDVEANFGLANILLAQGSAQESLAPLMEILSRNPDHAEAHGNLGVALRRLGQISEAKSHLRKSLEIKPRYAEALNNLGAILCDEGYLDESESCLRAALDTRPNYASAYNNLGNVMMARRHVAEAEAAYGKAIEISPEYAEARWNRALAYLLLGNFANGLREYEWRLKRLDTHYPDFSKPAWHGENLGGRRILLFAEQGLGDTLQFVRFAPMVAAREGVVIVRCQPELKKLLGNVPGVGRVISDRDPLPDFDVQCPLLSLPYRLDIDAIDKIPANIPYLSPPLDIKEAWENKLPKGNRLKVGLVWAGAPRPNDPDAHLVDRRRSMSFASLEPLLKITGIDFYSLQKGEAASQATGELIDPMDEVLDFSDTAAIISHLDLVISVDTAVVHLAGALGKPVWMLSRFDGCWRWMLERDDSPWYPTLRIFRQQAPGDWESVIRQVALALDAHVASFLAEAHNNLGVLLLHQKRFVQSAIAFSSAIQFKPEMAMAHFNLGVARRELNEPDEAATSFEHAIALKPDFAEAHVSLGMTLLLMGRLPEGFAEYEWRLKLKSPRHPGPQWDGRINPGATLLVHFEQGFGDAIQFVRYLPFIGQQGMRVVAQCAPALKNLICDVEGVSAVYGFDDKLPPFDAHCALLSLPGLFQTTLEKIPTNVPYLQASYEKSAIWRDRLAHHGDTVKIGLRWQGNPHHGADSDRSIDLAAFERLADIPGVTWVSLQDRRPAAGEVSMAERLGLLDVSENLTDLTDTTALIGQIDLIVSVDTAVAHLAGAMNRPAWVLLRHAPDWRWLLERSDSPWYPRMRLFRQKAPSDWVATIAEIDTTLRKIMASLLNPAERL